MTLSEFLKEGSAYLKEKKAEQPRLCAEILLAHVLKVRRVDLYLYPERKVTARQAVLFKRLLARRGQGEPLQYLTGEAGFYGLTFRTGRGVFIPRPETELLVQTACEKISGFRGRRRVLEVGTGCGVIGLTLAKLSKASLFLIDKSRPAVKMALENKRRLGIGNSRVRIARVDFKTFARNNKSRFGFVLSNPPYIPLTDRAGLAREVLREPPAALFGGPDGLDFIRLLIKESRKILVSGGYLIFEIGHGQRKKTADLLKKAGFGLEKTIRDLAGIDRVVVARKP